MKNEYHCYSFDRYAVTFKALQYRCLCGGKFDCVDLSKSDRNVLHLTCSNKTCPRVTFAHRKIKGPAFQGARWPLPA